MKIQSNSVITNTRLKRTNVVGPIQFVITEFDCIVNVKVASITSRIQSTERQITSSHIVAVLAETTELVRRCQIKRLKRHFLAQVYFSGPEIYLTKFW